MQFTQCPWFWKGLMLLCYERYRDWLVILPLPQTFNVFISCIVKAIFPSQTYPCGNHQLHVIPVWLHVSFLTAHLFSFSLPEP